MGVGELIVEVVFVIEMGVEVCDFFEFVYLYLMMSEMVMNVVEVFFGIVIEVYKLK